MNFWYVFQLSDNIWSVFRIRIFRESSGEFWKQIPFRSSAGIASYETKNSCTETTKAVWEMHGDHLTSSKFGKFPCIPSSVRIKRTYVMAQLEQLGCYNAGIRRQ